MPSDRGMLTRQKRGNRFNGNTVATVRRVFKRDSRYTQGGYIETWVKIPSAVAWAAQPGGRFAVEVVNEGLLLRPVAE